MPHSLKWASPSPSSFPAGYLSPTFACRASVSTKTQKLICMVVSGISGPSSQQPGSREGRDLPVSPSLYLQHQIWCLTHTRCSARNEGMGHCREEGGEAAFKSGGKGTSKEGGNVEEALGKPWSGRSPGRQWEPGDGEGDEHLMSLSNCSLLSDAGLPVTPNPTQSLCCSGRLR